MRHVFAADPGERPPVQPFSRWNRRNEQLRRDPAMHSLLRGVWVRSPQPPTPLQRAALLQCHLRTPDNRLRVTGLSALQLLSLPVGDTRPWVNHLLGHPAPEKVTELKQAMHLPHLAWYGTRIRTTVPTLRITKSRGLGSFQGPWGCNLAHPVEALVEAAPYLSVWRLTACIDSLLTNRIIVDAHNTVPCFDTELLTEALSRLPARSRGVRRVRTALRSAQGPTLSPNETLTRLIAVHHGITRPVMNHPVTVGGRTFYLDLAWPGAMVALEYNGGVHYENRAQYEDENHRIQLLRDAGWEIRVLVWADLWQSGRRGQWLEFLARRLG